MTLIHSRRGFILGAASLLFAPALGRAHSWYPLECCSQRDCFPLDQAAVERHADGYYVRPLKRTIPYAKANTSPDGQYHLCVIDPQRSPWELRASPMSPPASQWMNRSNVCFFAPPGGV